MKRGDSRPLEQVGIDGISVVQHVTTASRPKPTKTRENHQKTAGQAGRSSGPVDQEV